MNGRDAGSHSGEAHVGGTGARLNWLRAGVLGANDGIVSTSSLVIGVAASGVGNDALLTAGLAGLTAGALSMGVGEYVSVSTQRDTERALVQKEKYELEHFPNEELDELTSLYEARGLSPDLARQVAVQLTERDAFAAHAEVELGFGEEDFTNPWHAAWASIASFVLGALLPLITVLFLPADTRIIVTVVAAATALAITGTVSARLGGARVRPALVRNVLGGLTAMAITYGIGTLVGTHIG